MTALASKQTSAGRLSAQIAAWATFPPMVATLRICLLPISRQAFTNKGDLVCRTGLAIISEKVTAAPIEICSFSRIIFSSGIRLISTIRSTFMEPCLRSIIKSVPPANARLQIPGSASKEIASSISVGHSYKKVCWIMALLQFPKAIGGRMDVCIKLLHIRTGQLKLFDQSFSSHHDRANVRLVPVKDKLVKQVVFCQGGGQVAINQLQVCL